MHALHNANFRTCRCLTAEGKEKEKKQNFPHPFHYYVSHLFFDRSSKAESGCVTCLQSADSFTIYVHFSVNAPRTFSTEPPLNAQIRSRKYVLCMNKLFQLLMPQLKDLFITGTRSERKKEMFKQ